MKLTFEQQKYTAGADAGNNTVTGDLQHQRWLRELESARGKMLSATRAVAPGRVQAPQIQTTSISTRGPAPVQVDTVRASPWQLKTEHAAAADGVMHAQGEFLDTSIASPGLPSHGLIQPEPQLTQMLRDLLAEEEVRVGVRDQASSTVSKQERLTSGNRFSKDNIHLALDDTGVIAWVRDAMIGGDTQQEVAETIRDALSELGLRLSRLYVNGHPIIIRTAETNPNSTFA